MKLSDTPEEDSRLAPPDFLPSYKSFDQLLQTVINKINALKLGFKEFLQTSIPPVISVLYAKGYHNLPLKKIFSHSAKKISFTVSLISGFEKCCR